MPDTFKAPFPWFGGKSRIAHTVWERFGNVRNYVEPFAGSLAVLLARPTTPHLETVNDADCYLANFWRALQADPSALADHADWPINEADLHARHLWLVNQAAFRERMKTDPDYFDVKVAGWWVWGICQWIGSGWCSQPEWNGRTNAGSGPRGVQIIAGGGGTIGPQAPIAPARNSRQKPLLSIAGMGIHCPPGSRQLPRIGSAGINRICGGGGRHHRESPQNSDTTTPEGDQICFMNIFSVWPSGSAGCASAAAIGRA